MQKFTKKDFRHGQWMIKNQVNSPKELVALWMHFPNETQDAPYPEFCVPWNQGLEVEINLSSI